MDQGEADLPDDIDALKALLLKERAEVAAAHAKLSDSDAIIAHLKLQIAKLKREQYGQSSERSSRLIDQLELQLEEVEATASEDDLLAEMAAAKTTQVAAFTRKKPARKPFPEHLPRERILHPTPTSCPCCGGAKLSKLGEDINETLEVIPRSWKVIQHVREKVSCRDCETISQAPAPFHVIPRGWAGPSLLAMILFEKYGQHQPLNRQAERYAREGVELSLSTLADQVGHCAVALAPLVERLRAYVMSAERLHGDDTTVPVLARGKTDTARTWVYVRDDRPFGGTGPPAAMFYYSRDRTGSHVHEHLEGWSGILQADAYSGYNKLYAADRQPAPILEAACWSHYLESIFMWSILPSDHLRRAVEPALAQDKVFSLGGIRWRLGGCVADPVTNDVGFRDLRRQPGMAPRLPSTVPSSSRGRLLVSSPRHVPAHGASRPARGALVLPRGAPNVQSPPGFSQPTAAGAVQFDRGGRLRSFRAPEHRSGG